MADEPGRRPAVRLEVEERVDPACRPAGQLEQVPGPVRPGNGRSPRQPSTARPSSAMTRLGDQPQAAADLAGDELLGHLLILHRLTPVFPTGERVAAALAVAVVRPVAGRRRPAGRRGRRGRPRPALRPLPGMPSPATTVRDAITEATSARHRTHRGRGRVGDGRRGAGVFHPGGQGAAAAAGGLGVTASALGRVIERGGRAPRPARALRHVRVHRSVAAPYCPDTYRPS